MLLAQLASIAALVRSPKPEPEEAVNGSAHADHAERNGMPADETWFIRGRARRTIQSANKAMATKAEGELTI